MPVKIRLMRIGTNRRPFYRVVAVDERKKRTGGYLELLGTYNPLTEPKEINLDQAKIDAWMKKGAQPSEGFLRIIGKAPQRPPRKPKKAPKEPSAVSSVPSAEAPTPKTPEEETQTEEAPVVLEESIVEAPMPETAKEAAQVLEEAVSENSDKPDDQSTSESDSSGQSDKSEVSSPSESSENNSGPEESKF